MAYIYQAALWCDACGADLRKRFKAPPGIPKDEIPADHCPQPVGSPGESDSPCFCEAGAACLGDNVDLEAHGLTPPYVLLGAEGRYIGEDLTDGLTDEGEEGAAEFIRAVREGTYPGPNGEVTAYQRALATYYESMGYGASAQDCDTGADWELGDCPAE